MNSRDLRRKYGQNYLKDKAILFEMGEAIAPREHDNFIEIGPGLGALTDQINIEKINVTCIEIDAKNIEYLRKKYDGPASFKFINENILDFNLDDEVSNYRLIGNLPYNISTQIMLKFIENYKNIYDMHFLVQKEVAEKVTGNVSTKNWGKLALKISAFFDSEVLFDVPPESFDIKPNVNSSFIRLLPKKNINYDLEIKSDLYNIIDSAFMSRRKNIKNNLKNLNINWNEVDINPNKRSEELSTQDFIYLAKSLKK
ncbi:MAG: ribosomal RNA small subunit methyltransferase A [Gammaproteobacteria bacterium]|nr:ribosomal RNA small subunit methyltransferase A [Gammaproteobacteria bacterium]|tara:strand:- start:22892 stop:23659 length:768 start_codon:yes stop_codon:yes gene_type:complete